jgi:hypothetical protein
MIEGEVSIPPLVPDLNKQFEVICKWVRNLGTTFGAGRFISRQQRTAVPVCNVVPGAFTPVLAKHSKSFSLIDCISVGVDRIQRNFEPMRKQLRFFLHVPFGIHKQYAADRRKLHTF